MLVFDLFILRPRLRNVLISWILGWVLLRQCVHWVSALLFSGFNEFWGRWEWKSRFTCDWAWSGLEFVGLVPNRCGGAKHSLESRKNAEKWVHGPYSFPSCTALWPQFSMENRFPNLALYSCTSWSNRIMSLGPTILCNFTHNEPWHNGQSLTLLGESAHRQQRHYSVCCTA